jgi:hypothetical protein
MIGRDLNCTGRQRTGRDPEGQPGSDVPSSRGRGDRRRGGGDNRNLARTAHVVLISCFSYLSLRVSLRDNVSPAMIRSRSLAAVADFLGGLLHRACRTKKR